MMIIARDVGKYRFSVETTARWDCDRNAWTQLVAGHAVCRQLLNGKDGRAYKRTLARFYDGDTLAQATAEFESVAR